MNRLAGDLDLERKAQLAAQILGSMPWKRERPASPEDLLRQLFEPKVGGNWNFSMARPTEMPVGAGLRIEVSSALTPAYSEQLELPVKLITIQRHLSLSVAKLSKVLLVRRPTVYSWLAEESLPHTANLERVNVLYELAMAWNRRCSEPLGLYLREPLDGFSVLQLLENRNLDSAAVTRRFDAIAGLRRSERPRRSVLDLAREHGFEPMPEWMVREAIDSRSYR